MKRKNKKRKQEFISKISTQKASSDSKPNRSNKLFTIFKVFGGLISLLTLFVLIMEIKQLYFNRLEGGVEGYIKGEFHALLETNNVEHTTYYTLFYCYIDLRNNSTETIFIKDYFLEADHSFGFHPLTRIYKLNDFIIDNPQKSELKFKSGNLNDALLKTRHPNLSIEAGKSITGFDLFFGHPHLNTIGTVKFKLRCITMDSDTIDLITDTRKSYMNSEQIRERTGLINRFPTWNNIPPIENYK